LSPKSNKEAKVRAGVAISSIGHAVVLGWGLIAFAPAAFDTPPTESMPVDLVPITDITQLQAGNKDAPKKEQAKQTGEKKEEAKRAPEAEQKPKQPEVKQAAAPPPEAKPEPKPEPKKEEAKPEPKKEAATPLPPKREPPPKPQPAKAKPRDFNPDKIAALLDKRQPNERRSSEQAADTGAFGASTGRAPTLTMSEMDALRAQLQACWNPPVGAADAQDLRVDVRIKYRQDGTLAAEPVVLNRGNSPYFQVASEAALRAVRRCQPITMPAAKYEIWRDVEVGFDPKDMFGG
jgi:outer membrane biosynthesis protein TonB